MKEMNHCPIPAASMLLEGISGADRALLLKALRVRAVSYARGELVIRQGDPMRSFWLIVSGEVHAYVDHGNGRRTVAMVAGAGETFGVLFEYSSLSEHPTNCVAMTDTVVLEFPMIDFARSPDFVSRAVTKQFTANVIAVMSRAALRARFRAFVVSHQSTEKRVAAYLGQYAELEGANEFTIPLDRKEMAEFLDVERTALSAVLGRMRDRGLIEFRKNRFRLLSPLGCIPSVSRPRATS